MRLGSSLFAFSMFVLSSLAAAQSPGPDEIRTRDGAVYRGTIVEWVPGDHVTILLVTGEPRTFPISEIVSSGPTRPAPAPQAGTPAEPATGRGALTLDVTTEVPGLTLENFTGALAAGPNTLILGFERLCLAPCQLHLEPGNYEFVVQEPSGTHRPTRDPMVIDRDGRLHLGIESRRDVRVRRWLITLGSLAAGGALLGASFAVRDCEDEYLCSPNWALGAPAIGLISVGYSFLFAAIFARDRGRVEFTPY